MLSIINNNSKLEDLLINFQSTYSKRNHLEHDIGYEEILQSYSSFVVKPEWITTKFLNKAQSNKLIPSYLNKREQYFSLEDQYSNFLITENLIDNFYSHLSQTHPRVSTFCSKLIKLILIAELDHYIEGTTADELGIAHIDFKESYNQEDFNELIVHQITHTLLFIDDYIEPQVDDDKKNFLISTSLSHKKGGNKFPFYILFHSVCVGLEVLSYRYENNSLDSPIHYHPTTEVAIKRCTNGINKLNEYIDLFTHSGKELLYKYHALHEELAKRIQYAQ
ncbi:hypothetical protein [Fluoribacter gormanii]|uniref:HEXXH motif domain n=1 Tax=Fluoribacter gormanii TaxID=464 RepID=A0A377GG31_9GAMM|nr:hypothetical protein [Fluoribacter gormanii]KTD02729.1 hypothetical protein Lgor_1606 [Fluoribacter gormanii]SIR59897.1 hypothetical protein SAMN05421777_11688 [Fluoribacter gormanii]STO23746.1 Uncharacterised protein [Fluoribacter gormanii]